ncbi:hypothetical protein [Halopseudomonas sp.]|uniref:alpha/beta hydrolase n=1 Tax=Halopseudomonas sp. TaxID=2901191 RepID=UPI00311F41CC
MTRIERTLAAIACGVLLAAPVAADEQVRVHPDLVYGQGLVGGEQATERPLLMDWYEPLAATDELRPAVILAFGGSFVRGSKGDEHFTENGAQDSSMADYCRAFARQGFNCFSIEYRLAGERPVLAKPVAADRLMPESLAVTPQTTARIDIARQAIGLPPMDDAARAEFWQALLSASEDMEAAVNHVRGNAVQYGVDPERLALGGFSAGAITAINTAYGRHVPVKAVVSLSGSTWGYLLQGNLPAQPPALLQLVGQEDLSGVIRGSGAVARVLDSVGASRQQAWVPGFGHFYPMGAVSLGDDFSKLSVEQRVVGFLREQLKSE